MKRKFIFLLAVISLLCSIVGARAGNYDDYMTVGDKIPGIFITKEPLGKSKMYMQAGFLQRASDKRYVYCIDPVTMLDTNVKYDSYTSNQTNLLSSMSESVWQKITLIAYYGYGYGNHTDAKWYAITQFMIWKEVMPNLVMYFADTMYGPAVTKFTSEMAEINTLVNTHNTKPNFNGIEFTLDKGEEIIITDRNNVLSKYDVNTNDNINILKTSNVLRITGIKAGMFTINLINKDSRFAIPPILYYHTTSQNLMAVGRYDDISSEIRINVNETEREIEIQKYYLPFNALDKIPEEGIEFEFYQNNQLISALLTNEKGYGKITLPFGVYKVKQKNTINNYYKIDDFEINLDNSSFIPIRYEFINKEKTFRIELIKIDEDTKEIINQSGVKFKLTNVSNNESALYETNKMGSFITNELVAGSYILEEINPPIGYEKAKPLMIEINEEIIEENMLKIFFGNKKKEVLYTYVLPNTSKK